MRELRALFGKCRTAAVLTAALIVTACLPGPAAWAELALGSRAEMNAVKMASGSDGTPRRATPGSAAEEMTGAEADTGAEAGPGAGASAEVETGAETGEVLLATAADLRAARSMGTGDLWEDWQGDQDFRGEGTRSYPYQISTVRQLMGLSEAAAGGEDYEGVYFELTRDLDLAGLETDYGNWNPIGWYQNADELSGAVEHPFRGHFDGAGHTIQGLRIIRPDRELANVGLFGAVDGGSVRDLTVEAEEVQGADNAAVLAGILTGGAVVENVEVSGTVISHGNAGGIAGEVSGDGASWRDGGVVIENCRAEGIVLIGLEPRGGVGGIAGTVDGGTLLDNVVITQNGDTDRIQSKGYVGGIVGVMRDAGVYNSYVNGTIGGNGSQAVGGIAGKYESGELILARMAGTVARTNQGAASHEGTFVGTRDVGDPFTYGTERDSDLAYLFTTGADRAKRVIGSNLDGDNSFTRDAHIGCWTDLERKYVLVEGRNEYGCGDRYFYEELEDGVRYLITQKLGREFTADGYAEGLPFRPDHFAPGYMGEPVRGYLVSIPRIDARNANGTFDTDVAVLTAIPSSGNTYYREMSQDYAAAVAPGVVVTVTTAPKDRGEDRYQMIPTEGESGGVRPPTYQTETGETAPMQYVSGGAYTFRMPACDTTLTAEYEKVTTKLTVDPGELGFQIVMTRSGDRKQPSVLTEVKTEDGVLIARYIDGVLDQSVEVQPVRVHAEHNGTGQTADRRVRWSVDDEDLISNRSEPGYTETDGMILPDPQSDFVQGTLQKCLQDQADSGYREAIGDTVYTRYAVLTASTDPDSSVDHRPVYANCRVKVQFQILDRTTVRVERMELNLPETYFTITRRLTGNARNPQETITCSEPVVLTASLSPERPFYKNVAWADQNSGKYLLLRSFGETNQDCRLEARYDPAGEANPAWIQNLILSDRAKKAADPAAKAEGAGSVTETVTAVSEDQTHGIISASCQVTIRFETVDDTVYRVSGGSSSGGGGGGGGGGSSKGVTTAGAVHASGDSLPTYVVTGTWFQNGDGQWMFADESRIYTGEWAAVHNPYADQAAGQRPYDWFLFDGAGYLVTGWYTDAAGDMFYLHPDPDGTRGRMYTGWHWIGGNCYYFQEQSDPETGQVCGALGRNVTAPDGSRTNEDGAWIVDGVVQVQAAGPETDAGGGHGAA